MLDNRAEELCLVQLRVLVKLPASSLQRCSLTYGNLEGTMLRTDGAMQMSDVENLLPSQEEPQTDLLPVVSSI